MKKLDEITIKDICPSKAQYCKNEEVCILLEFESHLKTKFNKEQIIELEIIIMHFEKEIMSTRTKLCVKDYRGVLTLTSFECGGYGVIIRFNDKIFRTAFDVANNKCEIPRYGFLSDFTQDDLDDGDIISMLKLHINLVQFYDWMYRHEKLVSDTNDYSDIMGKENSLNVINHKINNCHKYGMRAIAYGAIYASSEHFYKENNSWGLFNSSQKPITFIDILYIMNINKECPWHNYIISQYAEAINEVNFDGIHMDTYGFPKSGYSNDGRFIKLEEEIPVLIDDTKLALKEIKDDVTLIFNNVGNWPLISSSKANQDILYVEVWEPFDKYHHIQKIIHDAKHFSDKSLVIAAYLKPYMNSSQEEAFNALALISSCIISNGATHLIMGEEKRVLTQGYYVDNYPMEEVFYEKIRKYYDFGVRYSEIFYDKTLKDVSMTHSYGDNREYVFEEVNVSPCAETGKIWTIIRENTHMKVISLINLIGNNNYWNQPKKKPVTQKNITIKIQIGKNVKGMYVMSPEKPDMEKMEYEERESSRGKLAVVTINEVNIWSVLVVKSK